MEKESGQQETSSLKRYFMISLPLMYFMYQLVLRLWMGQVQEYEIMRLNIDVKEFGYINSAYYAGYTLFQIPVALFFAKHRAQKILFLFSLLTVSSFVLGLFVTSLPLAVICRFLVGGGSVAGVLGLSRVISLWVKQKNYSSIFGLTISIGLIGLPLGQAPVKQWVEHSGQTFVGLFIGVLGFLLCFASLFFLREPQKSYNKSSENTPLQIKDLGKVLCSVPLWTVGLVSLLLVGTFEGLADVWGQCFLVDFYSMNKTAAASLMSLSFFGIIAGTTIIPWIGERIGHFSAVIICSIGLSIMSLLFIYIPMGYFFVGTVSFLLGIFSGYQTNLFSFGADYAPKNISGEIVVAFINCINMAGGSFFHWGIPFIMDYFWNKKAMMHIGENLQTIGLETSNKTHIYSIEMYQNGLLLIPIASFFGGLLFLYFLKNKKISH